MSARIILPVKAVISLGIHLEKTHFGEKLTKAEYSFHLEGRRVFNFITTQSNWLSRKFSFGRKACFLISNNPVKMVQPSPSSSSSPSTTSSFIFGIIIFLGIFRQPHCLDTAT